MAIRPQQHQLRLLVAGVLAVASLAVAGCSSSGGGTGSNSSGSRSASGTPITVGAINESAGAVAYPAYVDGMEAAVGYINSIGGVDGHPLKLDVCVTDGTSTSTQSCAQKFVSSKPLFVTVGLDNNLAVAYPLLQAAGIPVLGGTPVTDSDYSSKDAYFFEGGTPAVATGAGLFLTQYLKDAKKVGMLTLDIPQTVTAINDVKKQLDAAGVSLSLAKNSPTATDFVSPLSSLKPSSLDAIFVLQAPVGCVGIAKAAQSQSLKTKFISPANCNDAALIKSANGAMTGWYVWSTGPDPNGSDPNAVTYRDAVKKYVGAKGSVGTQSEGAFGALMTVYQVALKPLGYAMLTGAAVRAAFTDAKDAKLFWGDPLKCGAVPSQPAVCSFDTYWWTIKDGNGTLQSASGGKPVDASPALASS
jgi:branched-chain amino acid transport system substrate-binding protein